MMHMMHMMQQQKQVRVMLMGENVLNGLNAARRPRMALFSVVTVASCCFLRFAFRL
jgi:hypothetical protein